MVLQKRPVVVRQVPPTFAARQKSDFIDEVQRCLDTDRPCLVLDCSNLAQTDREVVYMLLCCLEEAMKRNGDMRLAGASSKLRAELQAAQADSLFGFYETSADAVASFYGRSAGVALRDSASDGAMSSKNSVT
jgi:anti-sigma B factor antagonist